MKLLRPSAQPIEAMAGDPVGRVLFRLAGPSIVAMLMQALYNAVDSMYVSRISDGSLAAVTIAFPVQMIMGALSTGVGIGINSCISRNLGAHDEKTAARAAENGLSLGLITITLMILFGIFGARSFAGMYTDDPQVLADSTIYIRTICLMSIGAVFSQLSFSVLQGSGNMMMPMFSQIAGGLIVILLDPVFIFTLNLGVLGAAVASSTAQIISALIGFYGIMVVNRNTLNVTFRGFRPDAALIKDILYVGIPAALTQATTSVVAGIVNKQIAVFGTSAIAAYGAFSKLDNFASLPVFGITRGMNPLLGFCCGEKNSRRFLQTRNTAALAANTWTFAAFILFTLAPRFLLRLMNADAEMMELGVPAFRILSLQYTVLGCCLVLTQLFAPVRKSYISMISALLRQVVLIVPLTMMLSRMYGINGIWAGITVANFINFAFILIMNIWLRKKVLSKWDEEKGDR